jgi:hypothetical protein
MAHFDESFFESHVIRLNVKDLDYHFHDLEKNSLRYICGYLMKKCLTIHSCDVCKKFANDHQHLNETTIYSAFVKFGINSIKLKVLISEKNP